MSKSVKSLANPAIAKLIPYQIGKPIDELMRETGLTDIIKLASNENPLGASPQAIKAALAAIKDNALYPDGSCYELKQALSEFYHLAPDYFTIGNGSENLLEIIVKGFLLPTDVAIISQYTFATIPLILKALDAELIVIPALDWAVDIDGMIAAISPKTKMIFLVNPNNPTGTYIKKSEFERLLKAIPASVIIVVDEAYNEYIKCEDYPDALNYLTQIPNMIITRTFSKAYGLAALRVGYAIAQPDVSDILNRARLPFNVNGVGMKAAVAALK